MENYLIVLECTVYANFLLLTISFVLNELTDASHISLLNGNFNTFLHLYFSFLFLEVYA